MLCLKIELYLSPSTAGSTDSCSCTCHDGPDQSLPDSDLVWYKPLSMVFFFNSCMWWGNHNSSFLGHKSSNIWINTATFGWGYYPSLHAHFSPREPSLLHSPSSATLFSSRLSLLMTRRSASTGPIHQVMTPAVSFPLTVVNLKRKRSLQCGGEGRE